MGRKNIGQFNELMKGRNMAWEMDSQCLFQGPALPSTSFETFSKSVIHYVFTS